MTPGFDAILLTGGTARRLGGVPKAGIVVAGRSLLARSLETLAGARLIVAVGPELPLPPAQLPPPQLRPPLLPPAQLPPAQLPPVVWTREVPAGGGPAAAVAAALQIVMADVVVLLAVDHPFAAPAIARLVETLAARPEAAGALLVDEAGRRQPLVGAYRRLALVAAASTISKQWDDLSGLPMRALLDGLDLVEVAVEGCEALDCDTPEDVALAERLLEGS